MIVYHGTSDRRARQICEVGLQPRKPSRRVWFAASKGYALRRAKVQARRRNDKPVVLTCEINLGELRQRLGIRRVFYGNAVIAIDGAVPVTVLRSHPMLTHPSSPEELAAWVNRLLGLKPYKGVGARHPGIQRLSKWVLNRTRSQPNGKLKETQLLEMATRWLPEFFEGAQVDRDTLQVHRDVATIDVQADVDEARDPREVEAYECLLSTKPKRRVRGLSLLAEAEVPDLFDWCVMFLDDASIDVRLAALRLMVRCPDGEPEIILPFAESDEKRIRGAAIAALAKHSGQDGSWWFERGLKDPCACVRSQTAAVLPELDPTEHRAIFELALHDPNPEIERVAKKLTVGKGFAKARW